MGDSVKKAVKERILTDMLGTIRDTTGGGWKVLILDELTTRVLSSSMKMSDILECNVSVVEDLFKDREPVGLAAVYFIQPTPESVARLIEDFESKALYTSVHVFFSSKVGTDAVARIKDCPKLVRVLKTLKESNVEFVAVDSHTLITDHPLSLVRLMGDQIEADQRTANKELDSIASRLVTLLTTLNEAPTIRYKLGRTPLATDPPGSVQRSTLTQRLAQKLSERTSKLQQAGALPSKDTCDMIILDRSYDPVAPVIHEWTYEAMVYDLLELDGNIYKYTTETNTGQSEEREVLIDEHDELWTELRHLFIAEVYTALATRFKDFYSKNKAAKAAGGVKAEMSTSNIRSLIQALPQYREVLSRLSLHIQISSDIKAVTNDRQLTEVGELEQDLVLGEKNSKDLLAFLSEQHTDLDTLDKMRLFMCYLATHPEKFDETKRQQWMKLAKLSPQDMGAVCNLSFLGVQVMKLPDRADGRGFFGSKKDKKEKMGSTRAKRQDEAGFALYRFDPLLKDIISDLQSARLSVDDFPYIRASDAEAEKTFPAAAAAAQSVRTAGRAGINWARRADAQASGSTSAGPSGGGRRLIVFIIGGATRSEMRLVHALSKATGRDIILGSTSIDTPHTFIDNLYKISTA